MGDSGLYSCEVIGSPNLIRSDRIFVFCCECVEGSH